jgi:type VI secretion system secreted protein Hcp
MAQGDMFLKIDGTRQGAIKGESRDARHIDEIDVAGWSWGMEGNAVHGQATSKTTVRELKVYKQVDRATTALLAALRNNEVLKEVVLTVRKAGGSDPVEYYKVVMAKARITSLQQQSSAAGEQAELMEELCIAFSKCTIEYKPQGADGSYRGAMQFEMDVYEGTS